MSDSTLDRSAIAERLTPEQLTALSALRDIQLQGPEPLFSPLLMGVTLLGIFGLAGWLWWRHPRQRNLRRIHQIRRQVQRAGNRLGRAELVLIVSSLQQVLRDSARLSGRVGVMAPGLSGRAWLTWMDERSASGDQGSFTSGPGQVLVDLPYADPESPDIKFRLDADQMEDLIALSARWVRANL